MIDHDGQGLPNTKFFSQTKEANGLQLSLKQKYYLQITAESVGAVGQVGKLEVLVVEYRHV